MTTWARVIGGLLLLAATATQTGVARTLAGVLADNPSDLSIAYRVAYAAFFAALTCTVLAAVLCFVGVRWLTLTLGVVALVAGVASTAAFVSGDTEYVALRDAVRFNLTGVADDAFYPSAFLAGFPTWGLILVALVVVAFGRRRASAPPSPAVVDAATAPWSPAAAAAWPPPPPAAPAAPVTAPAGWYQQPDGRARYWDGARWLDPS